ncbi:hypothetical protein GUJ93_ZPchr0008g12853 [Zizania palustris]|uniref:Uncharacterized protein n=1 Tax=Zizania palustris TaxID=103762 RepID=A0A8J5RD51_ZIZPA|nr:hypothetical protein GUJ93_ZPchr0008g12853 [Zizania palustris]
MRRWRKEAEVALRLERDVHHDEAITRAGELVAKHLESATTLSTAPLKMSYVNRKVIPPSVRDVLDIS